MPKKKILKIKNEKSMLFELKPRLIVYICTNFKENVKIPRKQGASIIDNYDLSLSLTPKDDR